MSEAGAVAWQFEQKGVVVAEAASGDAEDVALAAIDAGADDFETDDLTLHAYTTPDLLDSIRKTLEEAGASNKVIPALHDSQEHGAAGRQGLRNKPSAAR